MLLWQVWCELQGQRLLLNAGVYLIIINWMEITSVLYGVDQACQPEQVSASVPGRGGGCSRGVQMEPDQQHARCQAQAQQSDARHHVLPCGW